MFPYILYQMLAIDVDKSLWVSEFALLFWMLCILTIRKSVFVRMPKYINDATQRKREVSATVTPRFDHVGNRMGS